MDTSYQAKVELIDSELVATILTKDNQDVTGEVLHTVLPYGPTTIRIAFCHMPHTLALEYSTSRMIETLAAIAQATTGIAQETESWYALELTAQGLALMKPQRFTKDLSWVIEKQGKGWLNPMVLRDGNRWLLDLALSDETTGREAIGNVCRQWGVMDWTLTLKPDGLTF